LGLEGRHPAGLSGGQQQRAALARMLIGEPEAVLLDEPFSALDTNLREQMQVWMLELLENRSDVILVTHSRDEVFKLCGELLTMEGGRVLKKGKTGELFANPGLAAVARLTGCKNISPARITGERELYALDWDLPLRTAVPVGGEITHVGIRAHDFAPVFQANGSRDNLIPVRLAARAEEPFEEAVLFTNAAAGRNAPAGGSGESMGEPGGSGTLWWKYSKYLGLPGLPPYLYAPPERLLLLR
jgi:molybdate transport system ATP-binding protein